MPRARASTSKTAYTPRIYGGNAQEYWTGWAANRLGVSQSAIDGLSVTITNGSQPSYVTLTTGKVVAIASP